MAKCRPAIAPVRLIYRKDRALAGHPHGQKDRNMSDFFKNVWTKRVVSLLSVGYAAMVGWLAYMSIFYDLVVKEPTKLCVCISAVSVIALIIMLYTRKQFITKFVSIALLPLLLLPLLMFFGQWGVLIPPLVVSLIIFFFSGMGETAKTVWGTVFLLLYLLGSLFYFLTTSMFAPSTVTTTVQEGVSPTGAYRYAVTETVDSSNGCTKVVLESSELDKDYDMARFEVKGLSRDVKTERPLNKNVTIEWTIENRQDITAQILGISEDVEITLVDSQMDMLNKKAYRVTYSDGRTEELMQADYHAIVIPLSNADRELLGTDLTEIKLDEMSTRAKKKLGIQVESLRKMKLADLTDSDLATLGIPEKGDCMYYNGKCVFRYYVAILEKYFDISNQDLGLI